MKFKSLKAIALVLCLAVAMITANCFADDTKTADEAAVINVIDPGYSDRDLAGTWDAATATKVQLTKTMTISSAGVYVLSGTLTDGQIIVDVAKDEKVQLVLNGVNIHCAASAPIYIKQADKVFITLAAGTQNTITDGASYTLAEGADEPNAAIFSKDDLTINGTGALTVTANYRHGIVSKDDLVITNGQITVTAAEDGLRGKDCVAVCGGIITLEVVGDGIKSTNADEEGKGWVSIDGGTLNIAAKEGDGIQAETILQISDGELNITTASGSPEIVTTNTAPGERPEGNINGRTGGQMLAADRMSPATGPIHPSNQAAATGAALTKEITTAETISAKGIKGGTALLILGGTINVDALDDSLHTNGNAAISGGTLKLASGDDGIHADKELLIQGGTITISKSMEGLEGKSVTITGGVIDVTSSDDGINASSGDNEADGQFAQGGMGNRVIDEKVFIRISGGVVTVNAGGDGIDSNGNLYVDGGTVFVDGPSNNSNGALDYEGTAAVTGGTVIATGASGMAMNFSSASTQPSLLVAYSTNQEAGKLLTLLNDQGKTIASFTPKKSYQSVVITSPDLKQGKTYTLCSGETANKVVSVTMSNIITSISDSGAAFSNTGGGMGGDRGAKPGGNGFGGQRPQ